MTQLLQDAAATSAATVPLDLSDAELLEEVLRIHGNELRSDTSTYQAPPQLAEATRHQLFMELMGHAKAVGAALLPRVLSDAELLQRVARIHSGAARDPEKLVYRF